MQGYALLVHEQVKRDPRAGNLFVFRCRNSLSPFAVRL